MAPRYDPRLRAAIAELDDRKVSIAEVARRVGDAAETLGVPRPSYSHVWRHVRAKRDEEDAERERREALKEVAHDVATRLVAGRFVDPYLVADRVAEINAR